MKFSNTYLKLKKELISLRWKMVFFSTVSTFLTLLGATWFIEPNPFFVFGMFGLLGYLLLIVMVFEYKRIKAEAEYHRQCEIEIFELYGDIHA